MIGKSKGKRGGEKMRRNTNKKRKHMGKCEGGKMRGKGERERICESGRKKGRGNDEKKRRGGEVSGKGEGKGKEK